MVVVLLLSLVGVFALGFLAHWVIARLLVRIARRLAPATTPPRAQAQPTGNAMRVAGRHRSVVIWSGQGWNGDAS
jgi:hypothetical protein